MKLIDLNPVDVVILSKEECTRLHAGNCCPGLPQEPIDPDPDPKDPDTGTDD